MGHANSVQIAIVDMGSGWADDASAFGLRADKGRADGCEGAGLNWVEAVGAKLRAWI